MHPKNRRENEKAFINAIIISRACGTATGNDDATTMTTGKKRISHEYNSHKPTNLRARLMTDPSAILLGWRWGVVRRGLEPICRRRPALDDGKRLFLFIYYYYCYFFFSLTSIFFFFFILFRPSTSATVPPVRPRPRR